MGMFDSFRDAHGREWQTKAFDCDLNVWRVGDQFPTGGRGAFQVEVIHGPKRTRHEILNGLHVPLLDGYVTVRDGVVAEVPAERDPSLLLLGYGGHVVCSPGQSRE